MSDYKTRKLLERARIHLQDALDVIIAECSPDEEDVLYEQEFITEIDKFLDGE